MQRNSICTIHGKETLRENCYVLCSVRPLTNMITDVNVSPALCTAESFFVVKIIIMYNNMLYKWL